jgi:hypothetical protein
LLLRADSEKGNETTHFVVSVDPHYKHVALQRGVLCFQINYTRACEKSSASELPDAENFPLFLVSRLSPQPRQTPHTFTKPILSVCIRPNGNTDRRRSHYLLRAGNEILDMLILAPAFQLRGRLI